MTQRFFPLSESAVTVEFGNRISREFNDRAIALADALKASPFPGMVEAVPAYCSVTVFFDLPEVRRMDPEAESAHEAVRNRVEAVLGGLRRVSREPNRKVEIPLSVGKELSPDLDFVAAESGMKPDEVLELFLKQTYRVYMLGFLPGFAYMGDVDSKIAVGRKATPRLRVPKGSVAIAGRQAGIYSLECPGGWQIIGRTSATMFNPTKAKPSLLEPGDEVSFKLA